MTAKSTKKNKYIPGKLYHLSYVGKDWPSMQKLDVLWPLSELPGYDATCDRTCAAFTYAEYELFDQYDVPFVHIESHKVSSKNKKGHLYQSFLVLNKIIYIEDDYLQRSWQDTTNGAIEFVNITLEPFESSQ